MERGEEGPANSVRVGAYRVGMLASGSALLFLPLIAFFALTWYLARVETVVSWQRMLKWSPIIVVLVGVFYLTFTEVLNVRLPTGLFF